MGEVLWVSLLISSKLNFMFDVQLGTFLSFSTTDQAIQIGRDMNAKQTILTHFSAKFPKCPDFQDFPENVSFAFDFMQVGTDLLESVLQVHILDNMTLLHYHLFLTICYTCTC